MCIKNVYLHSFSMQKFIALRMFIYVLSLCRDLFIPYVFATGGAVASAIALKEMVVKVHIFQNIPIHT